MKIFGPDPQDISLKQIHDFLSLRKSKFVDKLKWDIPHTSEREWDQYDLPDALFIVAYDGGDCLGGARLLPTSVESAKFFGQSRSWMIPDFVSSGIIEPTAVEAQHLTADPKVWEMTRVVTTRPDVMRAILDRANEYLAAHGATHVLTISPVSMPKALEASGYSTTAISPPMKFDGRRYVALRTPIKHSA